MSRCPNCGTDELAEIDGSGNAFCIDCGEVVEPVEDGDGEAWCMDCGDFRPVDDDGCCTRCGAECEG